MLPGSQIESDVGRYREQFQKKIRAGLRRHLKVYETLTRQGKDLVSIRDKTILIPRFQFGSKDGVGQGMDGEKGSPVPDNEPGTEPGIPILEEGEYAHQILLALASDVDLEIPRAKKGNVESKQSRQHEIQDHPPGRLSYRRGYKHAIRQVPELIDARTAEEELHSIQKIGALAAARGNARYVSSERHPKPESNAVTLELLDTSGSLSDEKKENARLTMDLFTGLVSLVYPKLHQRWFVHDIRLQEVDRETQLRTRESGGTNIGQAYTDLFEHVIQKDYPDPDLFAVYILHLTDAENGGKNELVVQTLTDQLLPRVERFAFGQLLGNAQEDLAVRLDRLAKETPKMRMARIKDDNDLIPALKTFLGRRPNP